MPTKINELRLHGLILHRDMYDESGEYIYSLRHRSTMICPFATWSQWVEFAEAIMEIEKLQNQKLSKSKSS